MVSGSKTFSEGGKSLKVLNVNHLIDPVSGGGTAERTLQISRHLSHAGIKCSVLTMNIGLESEEASRSLNGVEVISLRCINKRFFLPLAGFGKMDHIVSQADIIHLMGHWTILNAMVYLAARRMKKPYVVCPAGALPIYGRSGMQKKIYNSAIGIRIIAKADGHVAITKNEIQQFGNYGIGPERVTIIPNGINSEDFDAKDDAGFRRKFGLGQAPIILFLGRLNHIKGPDLLLRAFSNLRDNLSDYQLVFAGPDGGMLSSLKRMVAETGLQRSVHFTGYLGKHEKSWAYHAASLMVIPSRQEAMSIVALEAGISGTPVLLTDQCGFDEIAEIRGGFVVPATVEGLQKGLMESLKNPSGLKIMGEQIEKYIRNNYSWSSTVDKYLQLYRIILEKKK